METEFLLPSNRVAISLYQGLMVWVWVPDLCLDSICPVWVCHRVLGVGAAGVMPGLGVLVGEIVGEIEGEIGGGTSIGIEGSGLEGTGVGTGVGRERGG
jgi:hypothetical protein